MRKRTLPDGTVRVQAWRCTKRGTPGTTVYDQRIALDWMGRGYDVELVAIDRHPDGSRSYHAGVRV